jgi:hypothetical protein
MIAYVTTGVPSVARPPKTVRALGAVRAASRTQSTHWMPTAAGR